MKKFRVLAGRLSCGRMQNLGMRYVLSLGLIGLLFIDIETSSYQDESVESRIPLHICTWAPRSPFDIIGAQILAEYLIRVQGFQARLIHYSKSRSCIWTSASCPALIRPGDVVIGAALQKFPELRNCPPREATILSVRGELSRARLSHDCFLRSFTAYSPIGTVWDMLPLVVSDRPRTTSTQSNRSVCVFRQNDDGWIKEVQGILEVLPSGTRSSIVSLRNPSLALMYSIRSCLLVVTDEIRIVQIAESFAIPSYIVENTSHSPDNSDVDAANDFFSVSRCSKRISLHDLGGSSGDVSSCSNVHDHIGRLSTLVNCLTTLGGYHMARTSVPLPA
jgi:hypothetical protein